MTGGSLRSELLDSDIEAPCPNCEYPVWIRLVEVVAHCAVLCPACRCRIWLTDADGSVQNAATDIDNAVDDLTRQLGGMFR
ncbi:hypothetical protein SAMN05660690_1503 [Geodermatophilus telluris]|uniref:Uncharacterized protein n=1 Tax=Geodermatophilus telluris TaxID=1190417 RepID=A0A1G6LQC7_9ACTN|nr:hypothetical protein [Geodermatophilus telluris]SDC45460.1 hypothetical protein SAMN05660690_1503 [Geodermatophilus telluris]